mmetsp:Transcript_16669/g.55517  ORF Transcript_16669/g.55517 Transcript_16669/m.55517 type:complete len:826 (-) Transcript_16669:38-2515(-)
MTTSDTTAPESMAHTTLSAALTHQITTGVNSPHRGEMSPSVALTESSPSAAAGNFRPCPQHNSEKLTLYSSRARCFGCVKCFQEGVLRGHQAQSLQRSVVEAKEKMQRQSASLQKQLKGVRELVKGNDESLVQIQEQKEKLREKVKVSIASLKAALSESEERTRKEADSWREGKEEEIESAINPIRQEIGSIDDEIAKIDEMLGDDDDETFLEQFYENILPSLPVTSTKQDNEVTETPANLDLEVAGLDVSFALKACTNLTLKDIHDTQSEAPSTRKEKESGNFSPVDHMTDAMELDRVAVIASGNMDVEKLSANDRRLLWKHRATLTDNKRALLKILKCIQWDNERQVRQVLELVPRWVNVAVEDALEMLGESYMHSPIRSLAVRSLGEVPDVELVCFLMPLTQALRYDVTEEPHLANFLIERAIRNAEIATALYWYLTVEKSVPGKHMKMYIETMSKFLNELQRSEAELSSSGVKLYDALRRQESFVNAIHNLTKDAKKYKETRPKQIERLMALLNEGGAYSHLSSIANAVNLPHQPSIFVSGIISSQSTILKSAMNPVKLVMRTTSEKTHAILYKSSNDLRRDQMILSCIDMMDMLLQKEGVDLRITTYRVTATSTDNGLVEWVEECFPLSAVLAEHDNDIRNFFKKYGKDETALEVILDNFVKSCAGYCVISFLLGIGDRHLDNLMLSTNGRLFHVDFEYILGNDPKPFAPPMKLSEQMVVAMGGRGSRDYLEFHKYCCKAYLILRKSAKLFVALFDLVGDLNLSGRSGVSNGDVIAERFQMDLTREEAVQYMQGLIQESLGAIFPQVVDVMHRWRLYFKT